MAVYIIYIYIYRERERNLCVYIYIYISYNSLLQSPHLLLATVAFAELTPVQTFLVTRTCAPPVHLVAEPRPPLKYMACLKRHQQKNKRKRKIHERSKYVYMCMYIYIYIYM